jgi:hypothetical protein
MPLYGVYQSGVPEPLITEDISHDLRRDELVARLSQLLSQAVLSGPKLKDDEAIVLQPVPTRRRRRRR